MNEENPLIAASTEPAGFFSGLQNYVEKLWDGRKKSLTESK